jgi:Family of unknown function (DUF6088)
MAISMIRRVVTFMPEGTIFTTRDMLVFGMRTAVDQALCHLVRTERIRRLARGVFAKCDDYKTTFTELQIVKAKAHSFGRRIIETPLPSKPATKQFGAENSASFETHSYCVEGHSSKFRIGDTIIEFKKVGQRRFELAKSKAGAAAHSVWQLGPTANDGVALRNAVLQFNRHDYVELRRNIQWMPAWLSDQIKWRPWDKFYENWDGVRQRLGWSS